MINTLYLPELREMLSEGNVYELQEFCEALHPARTAEFMEGLAPAETWEVLLHAEPFTRVEIFRYLETEKQIAIISEQDRDEIARLLAELAPDDRVDILAEIDSQIVDDLLPRLPAEERRDIMRLSQFPEGTAGAVMTTEVAKLKETLTVKEALDEIGRQAEGLETIYYIYVVDDDDHLRGLVSARQLVTGMKHPDTKLADLMETELVTAALMEDQEDVANNVAKLDLLAIPVVDDEHRMVGIITHDDIIDVMREEATEDAHRIAAVNPLDDSYLKTRLLTLCWKRGIWLMILFGFALFTAFALQWYDHQLDQWKWLVLFIPLIISSGGNSGSQSATLIITAISLNQITLRDWAKVVWREVLLGLMLGGILALLGFAAALPFSPSIVDALVLPITVLLVVVSGTLTGSILPLLFKKIGLDPAMMSNPFVAGIIDVVGIVIYMNVALCLLS
ncbi:MAG: magnesium transporter [Planctomycetota bacterium]|nr:magnesium transporter [Planctomycetota bacterium]